MANVFAENEKKSIPDSLKDLNRPISVTISDEMCEVRASSSREECFVFDFTHAIYLTPLFRISFPAIKKRRGSSRGVMSLFNLPVMYREKAKAGHFQ